MAVVGMSGLCQDTSFHPRSSARMKMIFGCFLCPPTSWERQQRTRQSLRMAVRPDQTISTYVEKDKYNRVFTVEDMHSSWLLCAVHHIIHSTKFFFYINILHLTVLCVKVGYVMYRSTIYNVPCRTILQHIRSSQLHWTKSGGEANIHT